MNSERWHGVPPEFFRTMSTEEWEDLFQSNGVLRGPVVERLWRFCDYQGSPPPSIEVRFRREDIERLFPKRQP